MFTELQGFAPMCHKNQMCEASVGVRQVHEINGMASPSDKYYN